MSDIRKDVLERIDAEREFQDANWGGPSHDAGHDDATWLLILTKQLGTAAERDTDGERRRTAKVAGQGNRARVGAGGGGDARMARVAGASRRTQVPGGLYVRRRGLSPRLRA